MNIYSYLYRNKYRSVINLSYVADTVWTHMASNMKHPVTVSFLDIPIKKHTLAKIIMARQRLPISE